mgnify:FL=1
MENLESISVYELFPKDKDQSYHAIHTLRNLFDTDKEYLKYFHIKNLDKTFNMMNSIRNHFSEFSIHPYLILKNLNGNEKEILDKLTCKIIPNLWKKKKLGKIIKKIDNPPKNKRFIENLLYTIKSDGNGCSKEFKDSSKAEKLFYFYANKNHIPLLVENLRSISRSYNQSCNSRDSLDD